MDELMDGWKRGTMNGRNIDGMIDGRMDECIN
jgi:hypothetical protein